VYVALRYKLVFLFPPPRLSFNKNILEHGHRSLQAWNPKLVLLLQSIRLTHLVFAAPKFLSVSDTLGIWDQFKQNGLAFVEGVTESSLVALSRKLGHIVQPRNEVRDGTGLSNIRPDPCLSGKGYTTEGTAQWIALMNDVCLCRCRTILSY
jgi:hypothetical protein